MKFRSLVLLSFAVFISACNTVDLFGPQSLHARYAARLKNAGLDESALARQWLRAADQSLEAPVLVKLPYRESGYFAADRPRAAGIRFEPKPGQKISISISIRPASAVQLFAELWRVKGDQRKLLVSSDTSLSITYEQDRSEPLLLRIQPELLVSVSYTLTIVAGPALAFPVPGNKGTRIGSFWGDARDGGKRSHEGIDIFDKFRTPVVAAHDGRVTQVNENKLGGKAVWLRPHNKPYTLYYAHLDTQIVSPLQQVKQGDTLGLMGNTGNAKRTAPHLHFGIYDNGPVDPLPFVQQVAATPPKITGDTSLLDEFVRATSKASLMPSPEKSKDAIPLAAGIPLKLQAATDEYYFVRLPNDAEGFVPVNATKPATVINSQHTISTAQLFLKADSAAAVITTVDPSSEVEVLGTFEAFSFVRYGQEFGWVAKSLLKAR